MTSGLAFLVFKNANARCITIKQNFDLNEGMENL